MKSIGKLEGDNGETVFFYWLKATKNYSILYFRFLNCNRII